jgi:hypothetical protein
MNTTEVQSSSCEEPVEMAKPRRTRIDAAHEVDEIRVAPEFDSDAQAIEVVDLEMVGTAHPTEPLLEVEEPTPEMLAAVAGENIESRREQLQLQVAQLAGHLRERLREVDRREATLNARVAQLESDLRSNRMWLRERELGFQERENELKRQIEELQERAGSRGLELGGLAGDSLASELAAREAEIQEREQQLQLREDRQSERRFEVDRQFAALRHAQQLWQQQQERQEQQLADDRERLEREAIEMRQQISHDVEQVVDQREEQLRTAELLVREHAQELDRDRAALAAEREQWQQQKSRQQQAIEELRTSAEAELTDRRTRLEARQEWIERQKGGLEQVRDEALRLHRQSLEMRLLAEQLWSQITGNLTPAEVTQAIAQLRLKLAEQYRVEEEQLVQRRGELVEISERIASQHREIEQLKNGVRDWAAARQAEIERQAAALVERELVLDAEQDAFRQAEQRWSADRRRYEQQIRDLSGQLRTLPVAA